MARGLNMPIHVQIWTGARNARVTDMTNAGKRGKTCRLLRFSGCSWFFNNPISTLAAECTDEVFGRLEGLAPDCDWEKAVEIVRNVVDACRAAGVPEHFVACYDDETCKGIDAPKPKLEAGNDKWLGWADSDGIHLRDLTDRNNEPCECTFKQTNAKAYTLAAKVWDKVKEAETMHGASEVLRAAGCKLHGWCAVD
jgi:hypothetical protein